MKNYLLVLTILVFGCTKESVQPKSIQISNGEEFELAINQTADFEEEGLENYSIKLTKVEKVGCPNCTDSNYAVIHLLVKKDREHQFELINGVNGFNPRTKREIDTLGINIKFLSYSPKGNPTKENFKARLEATFR